MVTVKEMMTKNPVKVEADKTVREAINIMAEKNLGSLLVYKGNKLVGLLEEGDIIRNVLNKDLNTYVVTVETAMSVPFVIDEKKTDNEANELMFQNRVRHLAVTNGEQITGIVSMQDLIRPVYTGKSIWV
ncbi:MAG TPA: CBS domain-containing protein [Nitrospiria bacterium]|nr:CBS domain-containing protein [Nitrospiria bacterium]